MYFTVLVRWCVHSVLVTIKGPRKLKPSAFIIQEAVGDYIFHDSFLDSTANKFTDLSPVKTVFHPGSERLYLLFAFLHIAFAPTDGKIITPLFL